MTTLVYIVSEDGSYVVKDQDDEFLADRESLADAIAVAVEIAEAANLDEITLKLPIEIE